MNLSSSSSLWVFLLSSYIGLHNSVKRSEAKVSPDWVPAMEGKALLVGNLLGKRYRSWSDLPCWGSYVRALGAAPALGVSLALEIAIVPLIAFALGRGRAIEVEGPSLIVETRTVGKIGLPGSGFGALAFGATSLLGALRLRCLLSPELTPGIPGASALMPAAEA